MGFNTVSIHFVLSAFLVAAPPLCYGLVQKVIEEPRNLVQDFTPKVLFESKRILAIEKPPNIAHHNDVGDNEEDVGEPGILSLLRLYYEDKNKETRLYGVHRLDRVTSGILLFAKDPEMAAILNRAFRNNLVIKYYVGISNRKPKKKKQGWVKGSMTRGRRKSWYLTRDDNGPNFAVTRFFTAGLGGLDSHRLQDSDDNSGPATGLLFRPHTGKTHQLRVAAKSVGLPLLGDPLYGDPCFGHRTYLHATSIHLPLDNPELGDCGHDPVTIWCHPPFADLLWEDTARGMFDEVLDMLLQKHCECPEILAVKRREEDCEGE